MGKGKSQEQRDSLELKPPVLVFSNRWTEDRDALVAACEKTGLARPLVLEGWRVPEDLKPGSYRIYAEALYTEAVARALGVSVIDAGAEWLVSLPQKLLKRKLKLVNYQQLKDIEFPIFIKSLDDKLGGIPGRVYHQIPKLPPGIDPDHQVCVSEIVNFELEVRTFLLNGNLETGSLYFKDGQLAQEALEKLSYRQEVENFIKEVKTALGNKLPAAIVLDVGKLANGEWAVIEANGAWGSGLYKSDPEKALKVIISASACGFEAQGKYFKEGPEVVWE